MAFNIKGIFGKDEDDENEYVEEGYEETTTAAPVYNSEKTVILLEPRAYSESQQIADYLKKNSSVIVNLKRVTPDQAKRIVDFLSGTLYAIEGDLQKLGGGIFLCTPHGMNVEGKISDDVPGKANKTNNGTKVKEEEEDEFNF
jgi:cell division inhibitor SepF